MTAALLTRIDPDLNMRRFYRIDAQPDLFGGVQVIREWGRIGSRGQRLSRWYATDAEAADHADSLRDLKLRRGYSPA